MKALALSNKGSQDGLGTRAASRRPKVHSVVQQSECPNEVPCSRPRVNGNSMLAAYLVALWNIVHLQDFSQRSDGAAHGAASLGSRRGNLPVRDGRKASFAERAA